LKFPRLTEKELHDNPQKQLLNFKRTKKFLVAIDTDGCVTDNMNGKQVLIFHPMFMEFYGLWEIETYYREVAEYYNLFSVHRGCNRFIAIHYILKALNTREDVVEILKDKKISLPDIKQLEKYLNYTKEKRLGLGNPSLNKFLATEKSKDFYYYKLLGWSEAVNRAFPYISAKIPPFKGVKPSLEIMAQAADIVVVSQTPYNDLADYWERHEIDDFVTCIAGQEMGSKTDHISIIKEIGGYKNDEILMIGDAFGDLKAVKSNDGLFYPIIPGSEEESWEDFPEAFEKFLNKNYSGDYEAYLIEKFNSSLPESPPWEKENYIHVTSYRKNQEMRIRLYKRFNPQGKLTIL